MTDAPTAYAIDAADGVEISLDDSSEDETFTITARREGEVLETHGGVTADTVTSIKSEHFTASHVDPPAADDSGDIEYDEDATGGEESEGVDRDPGEEA